MGRRLARNVQVGDDWYGPAHGNAEVSDAVAEQITNPNAWAGPDEEVSEQTGAGVGGGRHGDDPDELARLTRDELFALAEARQVDVPRSASKGDLVNRLSGSAR